MIKFSPHPDYQYLLIQANALYSTYKGQEEELTRLRKKDYTLAEEQLQKLEDRGWRVSFL